MPVAATPAITSLALVDRTATGAVVYNLDAKDPAIGVRVELRQQGDDFEPVAFGMAPEDGSLAELARRVAAQSGDTIAATPNNSVLNPEGDVLKPEALKEALALPVGGFSIAGTLGDRDFAFTGTAATLPAGISDAAAAIRLLGATWSAPPSGGPF